MKITHIDKSRTKGKKGSRGTFANITAVSDSGDNDKNFATTEEEEPEDEKVSKPRLFGPY